MVPIRRPTVPRTPAVGTSPMGGRTGGGAPPVQRKPPVLNNFTQVASGGSGGAAGGGAASLPTATAPGLGQAAGGAIAPTTLPQQPPSAAQSTQDELESHYQDMIDQHKGSWGDIEKGINAQGALQQRRMAEINAGMGRSVGGGLAGMFAQGMLGTQQNMLNARLSHDQQGRQMQMDLLDRRLRREERLEDREWQVADEAPEVPTEQGGMSNSSVDQILSQKVGGGTSATGDQLATSLASQYGWNSSQVNMARRYVADYYTRTGKWPEPDTVARHVAANS